MNLDKILEYQKIDSAIYKAEVAFGKSETAQKVQDVKKKFTQAQQELIEIDKKTADTFREIERIETQLSSYIAEQRTDLSYDSLTSLNQVDNLTSTLATYQDQIISLEKEGKRAFSKLKDLTLSANQKYAQATKIKKEVIMANSQYAEKQKELRAQFSKEYEALNEIKKAIPEELFIKYTTLRSQRKMPVFVAVDSGALNCNACGMQLSNIATDKLVNAGDMAECQNCRRILFVK